MWRGLKSHLRPVALPRTRLAGRRRPFTMAEEACEAQKPLAAENTCEKKDELPKLSAREFAIYNNMAEAMNYYVRSSIPTVATQS